MQITVLLLHDASGCIIGKFAKAHREFFLSWQDAERRSIFCSVKEVAQLNFSHTRWKL